MSSNYSPRSPSPEAMDIDDDNPYQNQAFNFEDELALNMASLALDWKPINPDLRFSPFSVSAGQRDTEVYNPIFACPPPPFYSISSIGGTMPTFDILNEKVNNESNGLVVNEDQVSRGRRRRYEPYSRRPSSTKRKEIPLTPSTSTRPRKNEYQYIDGTNIPTKKISTTRKPEERSKYLDPSLPTTQFWNFVRERSEARTLEIREAWKVMMEDRNTNSVVGSYCGSVYDCTPSLVNKGQDKLKQAGDNGQDDNTSISIPSERDYRNRKTLYSDYIKSPKSLKDPWPKSKSSFEGIELIDRPSSSTSDNLINRLIHPKSSRQRNRRRSRMIPSDWQKNTWKVEEAKAKSERRDRSTALRDPC